MIHRLNYDITELIFRLLFSLIFLGLGAEHLFDDRLIQNLMPAWMEPRRLVSALAGLVLLAGGCSIALGYKTMQGALVLGAFLVVVTLTIHVPALWQAPESLSADWAWLWQVYQRSNLVKNLCLLGVCFHLINHRPGRYSLDEWLAARRG
ncbi:DoxX family protein [Sulfidibacter corallicola]|uniref:DoxX family protein n=1 Tax=Sulfidibacter corallicola TaxID=2818388 RepID=A0A8A4TPH1_SULCO|nr:DoxX family protein [Sulfidibacter corallicola]QTD50868.1 DoxX family protein [Sulfidibacter corallicola]